MTTSASATNSPWLHWLILALGGVTAGITAVVINLLTNVWPNALEPEYRGLWLILGLSLLGTIAAAAREGPNLAEWWRGRGGPLTATGQKNTSVIEGGVSGGEVHVGDQIEDQRTRVEQVRSEYAVVGTSARLEIHQHFVPPAAAAGTGEIGELTHWVERPASLKEHFVGRDTDLRAVEAAFARSRAVVIAAGPGTGKSRLAAEYAHRTDATGCWTAAGSSIDGTLAVLAERLGLQSDGAGEADLAGRARAWLQGCDPATLWVVDNVADMALVNGLLNSAGRAKVLVTTRDDRGQAVVPTVAVVRLRELSDDAAVALLCSRRDRATWDPAVQETAAPRPCGTWREP